MARNQKSLLASNMTVWITIEVRIKWHHNIIYFHLVSAAPAQYQLYFEVKIDYASALKL